MSDILSEDGQKVFNYFMKAHGNGNKDVQRAASVDALLGALMYQRLKEYYDKLGKEYSAEDFILRTQVEAGGALISADDIQVQNGGDLVVKGLKVHPDFVEGNRITGNVKGLLGKIVGILDSEEPQNAMALRSFIPADIADDFLNAMQENDIERAKEIVSDKAAAMEEVYNQITVPLNLDEQVEILDFDKMEDLAMSKQELIEYLKDLPKQEIMSADLRATVGLPENSDKIGQKHLFFNKSTYKDKNRVATRKTLNSFSDVIANARLVEVEPNTKVRDYSGMNSNQKKRQTRKNSVPNYYRFFVPIWLNGEIYTLVISAEETAAQNGKAAKTRAYEIFTVKNGKKKLPAPQRFDGNTPSDSVSGARNTVSIRETLANVKDRNGDYYINEDGTGNFAPNVTVLNQVAYHGSPYDFDRFDLGAIGTGEGAQAHGWGLYFAKYRNVSEWYKKVLSNEKGKIAIYFRGEKYRVSEDELSYVNENTGEFVKAKSPLELALGLVSDIDDFINDAEGSIERAISKLQSHIESIGRLKERDPELYEDYADTLKNYEETKNLLTNRDEWNIEMTQGVLYEVDVPESSVMLDEDKPLYEQPPKVRKAIVEYYKSRPDYYIVPEDEDVGSSDGKTFYKDVVSQMRQEGSLTPEKDASLLLKSFGIEGITYEGGRDGRCFVVFDDKAVSVIEKYNQAVNGNAVKGSTVFQSNGQRIIQLFESADESTFLHEMSHIYLDELKQLAEMAPDSDAGKDYATIMAWASYKEGASAEYAGTATASEFASRTGGVRL